MNFLADKIFEMPFVEVALHKNYVVERDRQLSKYVALQLVQLLSWKQTADDYTDLIVNANLSISEITKFDATSYNRHRLRYYVAIKYATINGTNLSYDQYNNVFDYVVTHISNQIHNESLTFMCVNFIIKDALHHFKVSL